MGKKSNQPWAVIWEHRGRKEYALVGNKKEAKEQRDVMFNFFKSYFPNENILVGIERTSFVTKILRKLGYKSTGRFNSNEANLPCHYGCGMR